VTPFAARLSTALRSLHVSDRQLARRFAVTRATVQRWRSGEWVPDPIMQLVVLRALPELRDRRDALLLATSALVGSALSWLLAPSPWWALVWAPAVVVNGFVAVRGWRRG